MYGQYYTHALLSIIAWSPCFYLFYFLISLSSLSLSLSCCCVIYLFRYTRVRPPDHSFCIDTSVKASMKGSSFASALPLCDVLMLLYVGFCGRAIANDRSPASGLGIKNDYSASLRWRRLVWSIVEQTDDDFFTFTSTWPEYHSKGRLCSVPCQCAKESNLHEGLEKKPPVDQLIKAVRFWVFRFFPFNFLALELATWDMVAHQTPGPPVAGIVLIDTLVCGWPSATPPRFDTVMFFFHFRSCSFLPQAVMVHQGRILLYERVGVTDLEEGAGWWWLRGPKNGTSGGEGVLYSNQISLTR